MEDIVVRISERLSALGKSKHWLSSQLEVTPSAVYNWFGPRGGRGPERDLMPKLADVLETTTDYLFGRTDDPNPLVERLPRPPVAGVMETMDGKLDTILSLLEERLPPPCDPV